MSTPRHNRVWSKISIGATIAVQRISAPNARIIGRLRMCANCGKVDTQGNSGGMIKCNTGHRVSQLVIVRRRKYIGKVK